jgi:hypothetical protein
MPPVMILVSFTTRAMAKNQEHHVGRNPPHTDRKNLDSIIYDFEIGKQLRHRE